MTPEEIVLYEEIHNLADDIYYAAHEVRSATYTHRDIDFKDYSKKSKTLRKLVGKFARCHKQIKDLHLGQSGRDNNQT